MRTVKRRLTIHKLSTIFFLCSVFCAQKREHIENRCLAGSNLHMAQSFIFFFYEAHYYFSLLNHKLFKFMLIAMYFYIFNENKTSFCFCFVFRHQVLLCSPGRPRTCDLTVLASQVLRLQRYSISLAVIMPFLLYFQLPSIKGFIRHLKYWTFKVVQ